MHRRFSALTAAALVGVLTSSASAKPEASVRVRGGSRLEAVATSNTMGTQVSGTLRDDAGRPVRDARLKVRWMTAAGARLLPRPTPCTSEVRTLGASETDEAVAETDGSGRFCLRWPLELPDGSLSISYEDERGLLDAITDRVELDRKPPVGLAYSPPPTVFAAEAGPASVVVEARTPKGNALDSVVALTWVRVDKGATELTRGELHAPEALRLAFSPVSLGAPGNGELVASAELSGRRIECRAPVTVTARASVAGPEELAARSDGSAELSLTISSVFGPVPSGSVEATAHGRTIGIAPVVAGKAELELHAPAVPGNVDVTLRYLSAAPYWLPDGERILALSVPRPSPWRWTPWAAGLLAIGVYLLAGWRRPPRRELSKNDAIELPPDRAVLEWVAPERAGNGWAGRVSDAHDGAPIAGARVFVHASDTPLAEAVTDEHGEFQFAIAPGLDLNAALIRVDSTWHSALEKPLPPPGRLAISLLTRRRALLATLVDWAQREGRPFVTEREPTPGEVRAVAAEASEHAVADWARGVEDAAFGPNPVDADREAGVRAHEPKQ